jgi:hypothetical protein
MKRLSMLIVAAALAAGCGGGGGGGGSTGSQTTDPAVVRSVNVSERYDYLVSGRFVEEGRTVTVWGALSMVIRQDQDTLDKSGRVSLEVTQDSGRSSFISAFHSYFGQDSSGSVYYRGEMVGARWVQVESPTQGICKIKSPVQIGESWDVLPLYADSPPPGPFYASVTGRETVATVAGNFDCYTVTANWNEYAKQYRFKYWFAPRVGMPVRVNMRLGADADMTLELMNYASRSRFDVPPPPPDTGGPGVLPIVPSPDAAVSPSISPIQQKAAEFVVRMLG